MRTKRLLTLSVTALVSALSHAGDLRYFLAYGDANLAALNGSSMGKEIPSNKPLKIPGKGQSFTVQVWVTSTATIPYAYTAGCLFLGYDRGASSRDDQSQSQLESKGAAKVLQSPQVFGNFGSNMRGLKTRMKIPGIVKVCPILANAWASSWTASATASLGVHSAFGFGLGNYLWLAPGDSQRLADVQLCNKSLSGSFGTKTCENGLTLNSDPRADSRACFMVRAGVDIYPDMTAKYSICAP